MGWFDNDNNYNMDLKDGIREAKKIEAEYKNKCRLEEAAAKKAAAEERQKIIDDARKIDRAAREQAKQAILDKIAEDRKRFREEEKKKNGK